MPGLKSRFQLFLQIFTSDEWAAWALDDSTPLLQWTGKLPKKHSWPSHQYYKNRFPLDRKVHTAFTYNTLCGFQVFEWLMDRAHHRYHSKAAPNHSSANFARVLLPSSVQSPENCVPYLERNPSLSDLNEVSLSIAKVNSGLLGWDKKQ